MTLLGLDFDNTLVRYDKLFHKLALEKGLINESLPADKTTIRDYLRNKGQDKNFTLLQGEVYGPRILEADASSGMLNSLTKLKNKGIEMVLISHKTRIPYQGPKYDLRGAAIKWLEKHGFFDKGKLNWGPDKIFFEDSKESKIQRIHSLDCTHYIDDLPEILELLNTNIQRILYNPRNKGVKNTKYTVLKDWHNLEEILQ